MACCTIPPLNSPQKRNSNGIFDLPRSAKRRRPFSTTNLVIGDQQQSEQSNGPSNCSTMFTTINDNQSSSTAKTIVINASKEKQSPFNQPIPYSPMSFSSNSENPTCPSSNFKQELMERIRYEAKRLNRRNGGSAQIKQNQQLTHTSNNLSSSDESDQENSNSSIIGSNTNSPSKVKLILDEMNKKKLNKAIANAATTNTSNETNSILAKSNDNVKSVNNNNNLNNCLNKLVDYNDLPLFSMNQVNQICERMLKEKEMALREQYDKILSQKLNEQYDSFVRFTHEQIQRRFETSQCSYVS